jgi:hypothetical protein
VGDPIDSVLGAQGLVKFGPMSFDGQAQTQVESTATDSAPFLEELSQQVRYSQVPELSDFSSQELQRRCEEDEKKRLRDEALEEEKEGDENRNDNNEVELPPSQPTLNIDELFGHFSQAYDGLGTLFARSAGQKQRAEEMGVLFSKLVLSDLRPDVTGPNKRPLTPGLLKVALFAHYYELNTLLNGKCKATATAQRMLELLNKHFDLSHARNAQYRGTLAGGGSTDKNPWGGFQSEDHLAKFMEAFCPLQDRSRNKEVFEAILQLRDDKKRVPMVMNLHSLDGTFRLSNFSCDMIIRLATTRVEKNQQRMNEKHGQRQAAPTKKAKTLLKPLPLVTTVENKAVFRVDMPGVDLADVLVRRRKLDLFVYAGPFKATVDDQLKLGKDTLDGIVDSLPAVPEGTYELSEAGQLTRVPARTYHMLVALPSHDYEAVRPEVFLRNGVLSVFLKFKPKDDVEDEYL